MTGANMLEVDIQRGAARLTLDSPANRNALSRDTLGRLQEAIEAALADETVRVLVLDHTGRVFCSGMDLAEASGAAAGDQVVNALPRLLETIWHSPKPVVAVVRGPARGGGVGLLAAADIVVAGHSATFGFSEVRIGVVPAVISPIVARRTVPNLTHRFMLTGEVFNCATALAGGLVDVATADDEVDAAVAGQVNALVAGGPRALAETKRLLREGDAAKPLSEVFPALLRLSADIFASPEAQEGIASFREKRPASWVPTAN
jgi:methylglutaconyl-CoA hydratase